MQSKSSAIPLEKPQNLLRVHRFVVSSLPISTQLHLLCTFSIFERTFFKIGLVSNFSHPPGLTGFQMSQHSVKCVGCIHLPNRYQPLVTLAVHQRVDAPVEQAVLGLQALYRVRTELVVLATAAVRIWVATDVRVAVRDPALAAPLRVRKDEQPVDGSPLPFETTTACPGYGCVEIFFLLLKFSDCFSKELHEFEGQGKGKEEEEQQKQYKKNK